MCIEPPTAARGVRVYRQCATGSAGTAGGPGNSSSVPQRMHRASCRGTIFRHVGQRRCGSSYSLRKSTAATSPMKGGMAESRNQSRNELPLILPITPPARPKKKAMTRKGTSSNPLEQRSHRPQHGHDRNDGDDEPRDGGDDADDDLEQDPRRDGEEDDGDHSSPERGAGLLVLHAPRVLPRGAGVARVQS